MQVLTCAHVSTAATPLCTGLHGDGAWLSGRLRYSSLRAWRFKAWGCTGLAFGTESRSPSRSPRPYTAEQLLLMW
ncbi:hypothetical protein COCON_G00104450 [Conger conger]|uniref:Uncharacterized protein n=1 Tax=Conger conger TaxID=82655 RepID=A0A9Q1HXQ3_CONCO|nr:hypothetical protein COCON_G00104450 [Conger conger]